MAGDYTFYQIPDPNWQTGHISYAICPRCGKHKRINAGALEGILTDAERCTCPPEPEPPKQYAQGWVCPKCGRVNAPWIRECLCWMFPETTATVTTKELPMADIYTGEYGNARTSSSNITNQDVDELTDDLHELCVRAVNVMVEQGVTRHVSYITPEDNINFQLSLSGKIPKVTIEWVDSKEAEVK